VDEHLPAGVPLGVEVEAALGAQPGMSARMSQIRNLSSNERPSKLTPSWSRSQRAFEPSAAIA